MNAHPLPSSAGSSATERLDVPLAPRATYCILGLPFDAVDRSQVIARIRAAIDQRIPLFITTPNTNNLIASRRDISFRNSFVRSDLAIADGMPIVWIAKLLGLPLRERLAGASLFDELRRGAAGPIRIYIFGGPDGAAKKAHDKINRDDGPMTCAGWCSPGFGSLADMSSPAIIDAINRARPDLVLAALGSQKGQAWVERNRASLDAPVIMHLGAVVNFAAGTLNRAPNYIQNAGFEWAWRIKEEPMLWRRYWNDGRELLALLVRHLWPLMRSERRARRSRPGSSSLHVSRDDETCRITLSGAWTGAALSSEPRLAELQRPCGDIQVDLRQAGALDSAAVGWLMNLYGRQSNAEAGFRIGGASAAARRSFTLHRAEFLFAEPLAPRTSAQASTRTSARSAPDPGVAPAPQLSTA
jgi:N-acetylglucosaminyldiphosphoundecaprenol N-acetyl-beta-D-mannosaminyltransferase